MTTAREVGISVRRGLEIACEGIGASWGNQAMRRVYRQSFKYWAMTCCGVYLFGLLLFLPIYVLVCLVDLIFRFGLWDAFPMWGILGQISLAIPMVGALFFRYLYPAPLHDVFFSLLAPSLREGLEKLSYPDLPTRTAHAMRKHCRAAMTAIFLLLLSCLPWVGILVFPLAQFFATLKRLGLPLTLLASVISFIPGVRVLWVCVIAFIYGSRAICLELMDPFLERLRLDKKAAKDFLDRNQLTIISFSLPFTLLVALPVIGPLSLPLFQSCVAVLVNHLADNPAIKQTLQVSFEKQTQEREERAEKERIDREKREKERQEREERRERERQERKAREEKERKEKERKEKEIIDKSHVE